MAKKKNTSSRSTGGRSTGGTGNARNTRSGSTETPGIGTRYQSPEGNYDLASPPRRQVRPGPNSGMTGILICAIPFVAGVLLWVYMIVLQSQVSRRLLLVQVIAAALILLVNLYQLFFRGYDDNVKRHLIVNFLAEWLFALGGSYIGGVYLLTEPVNAQAMGMYTFMEFMAKFLVCGAMAMIPCMIISVMMWLVVQIFGKE
ncbi:MAG: hypothetical protein LUC98_01840 [Lachnospiraceae bacterium]|nr:hypothetical protein [Lachnospiraceae bacterium]